MLFLKLLQSGRLIFLLILTAPGAIQPARSKTAFQQGFAQKALRLCCSFAPTSAVVPGPSWCLHSCNIHIALVLL